jgi:hypothetical protein
MWNMARSSDEGRRRGGIKTMNNNHGDGTLKRYQWHDLNRQQVGAYAEYFVKMEMTMYGFQVYDTEVDDRGVDFVARYERGPFLEIQVKSVRKSTTYVFMEKTKFVPSSTLFLAFAKLKEGAPPELYLIPSIVWNQPHGPFVSRDYGDGRKSKPEWGLNQSVANSSALDVYNFFATITKLREQSTTLR